MSALAEHEVDLVGEQRSRRYLGTLHMAVDFRHDVPTIPLA
jgi:hypothetical protein